MAEATVTLTETRHPAIKQATDETTDFQYKVPLCDECLQENSRLNESQFMCRDCDFYFCTECLEYHSSHKFISRNYSSADIRNVVQDIKNEEGIEETFEIEIGHIINRINVKHSGPGELNEDDCSITGVCILRDKRVIICDYNNSCIKIYSSVTYTLERYLSVSSQPWDIIEIKGYHDQQPLTDLHVDGNLPTNNIAIAFTCIHESQILFANINDVSSSITNRINVNGDCSGVAAHGDKILTVFENHDRDYTLSVAIYNFNGVLINIVRTDITGMNSYLTILPGTDSFIITRYKDTIQKVAFTGTVLKEYRDDKWRPEGVCVGEDETIYVCAMYKNALCKMPWDLSMCETLIKSEVSEMSCPMAVSLRKNNVFVSHLSNTEHKNYFTKVLVI